MRRRQMDEERGRLIAPALIVALVVAGGWLGVGASPAAAVVPGQNGLIAFTRFRGADTKIFTMSAKGEKKKKAKQITREPGYDRYPAFSPDGSKIAFEREVLGSGDIWVVDARGGNEVNLTNSPEDEEGATWSPEGGKIAFSRDGAIWVMNGDGTNQTLLNDDVFASRLDWSPNGDKIAFERIVTGVELWIIDSDGTDPVPVATNVPPNYFNPAWSPDGGKIAFERNSDIWLINPDGTGETQLTSDPNVFDATPAWSPDGTKVLFERNGHFFQVPAAGGVAKQIKVRTASFQPNWQTKPGTGPDSRTGARDQRPHHDKTRARHEAADRRR